MNEYGVVTKAGTIRFERRLPGPIERVWDYLTDSEKRGTWLASGPMELKVGGRVQLQFQHATLSPRPEEIPAKYQQFENGDALEGRITEIDPPHLLSYTWGVGPQASIVTFELSEREEEILLVVEHRRLQADEELLSVAGGWHAHLNILVDRTNGRESRGFWAEHTRLEREYEQRFAAV